MTDKLPMTREEALKRLVERAENGQFDELLAKHKRHILEEEDE